MRAHVGEHKLVPDESRAIDTRGQVLAWENDPGLPADAVLPVSGAFQPVDEARAAWLNGTLKSKKFGLDWVTQQWLHFLDNMPGALKPKQLADLDEAYGFTRSQNAQIERSWLELVIRNSYQPGFPRLETYLTSVGRRVLIEPLYTDLMKTASGTEFAKRVYAKARPGYHPSTATAVDAIVNAGAADTTE